MYIDEQYDQEEKGDSIEQFVCFKLADEEYAVDITHVQEVIKVRKITAVPQMPDFTLGIINIRGAIFPVFDLRRKFGLPEKAFDDKTKIIVATVGNLPLSAVVDDILDNVKFATSQIKPPPNVRMKIERECISGVVSIDNRLIVILNLEKVSSVIMDEVRGTHSFAPGVREQNSPGSIKG
jgi:purine-binding chemotaxis protein CheW